MKRAPLTWILSLMALGANACSAFFLPNAAVAPRESVWTNDIIWSLLAVNSAAALAEFITSKVARFRFFLVLRAASLLLLLPYFFGRNELAILTIGIFLVDTSIYEPYPKNLVLGSAFLICVLAIRVSLLGGLAAGFWCDILLGQADFALLGMLLVLLSGFFTRYREELIAAEQEREKLKLMVVDLAKTNLRYQDYATEATKSGIEEERLRITRDIHDVVGYTLTNNIAMMEAATDMMRRNPLGIPALLKAARENAQDGLQQIRSALYQLRDQREVTPRGIRAITLLCDFFQKATHIEVEFSIGNARREYSEPIDSTMYHFVQEGLLNAFRHGKAPRVRVSLWETGSDLLITLGDDGVGATVYKEGIGLRGMRERLESLSGELKVSARPGSFTIHARMPLEGEPNG